jgi:SAM-dependent methyltransferase
MDTSLTPEQLAAELYDLSVPDWPGELDFYRRLARQAGPVLEVACGTGRVTIPLFDEGIEITGSDLDSPSLEVARRKRPGLHCVEADMRMLDIKQIFALIIIPGHSFQAMLTPQDQLAALTAFRRHLLPGGTLVIHLDHQDVRWLAEVSGPRAGVFEARKMIDISRTGERIRPAHAWTFDPVTQTATVTSK